MRCSIRGLENACQSALHAEKPAESDAYEERMGKKRLTYIYDIEEWCDATYSARLFCCLPFMNKRIRLFHSNFYNKQLFLFEAT